jgi:type II secretory pathway pseudopilin PulG
MRRQTSIVRTAFTLTELIVVSVVMTTALLGVYTVFKQAIEVEAKATAKWRARASAEAVLNELTQAIEGCVNLPGITTLSGGPDTQTGGYALTCMVEGRGYDSARPDRSGVQRRRYRWTFDSNSPLAGTVSVQAMSYAGTVNITPVTGIAEMDESQAWDRLASEVIGQKLSGVSVLFRTTGSEDAKWEDRYGGSVGKVAVWVRVTVGDETAERVVIPQANGELVSQEGS